MKKEKYILGLLLLGNLFFMMIARAHGTETLSGNLPLSDGQWKLVKEFPQKAFPHSVPPGNYSGITHLHDDIYAVVSDKSDSALYYNFRIQINLETGELENVENLGYPETLAEFFHNGRQVNGFDHEAIAKVSDSTLVVASEGKYNLKEYPIQVEKEAKNEHFWELKVSPSEFYPNYVFESLAYDTVNHKLWTMSESVLRRDGQPATPQNRTPNQLRLLGIDWTHSKNNSDIAVYAYSMDKPTSTTISPIYVMGVSELCVLPDSKLLVLERECSVPKIKLGAFCHCKLYVVNPKESKLFATVKMQGDSLQNFGPKFDANTSFMQKYLLVEWKTSLSLFGRSFANYEGMCLGPKLKDGSQVIILLADSQNQYAGVLKDWFKTIVIKP